MLERAAMVTRTAKWFMAFGASAFAFHAHAAVANASEIDAAAGKVKLGPETALRVAGFESESLEGWTAGALSAGDEFAFAPNTDALAGLVKASDGALEGGSVLSIRTPKTSIALIDKNLFSSVVGKRVEIRVWARSNGAAANVFVSYELPELGVRAIPTGRETSDGWVELSTGPVDGSVYALPITAVVLGAEPGGSGSIEYDAFEMIELGGTVASSSVCTAATASTICGADAVCVYSHCVASSTVWSPLPPKAMRSDLVERWIHLATHWMGDRAAADRGEKLFTPNARKLVEATSAGAFYGGLITAVNGLRDSHTSGGVAHVANVSQQSTWAMTGAVGACFGLAKDDRAAGGLVFAVYSSPAADPLTQVPLQVGDVLLSVDGKDPSQWVEALWPLAGRASNDPRSEPSVRAVHVGDLLARAANRFEVARCKPATDCSPANRTIVSVDVATPVRKYLAGQATPGRWSQELCSPRFQKSVASATFDWASEEDSVFVESTADTTSIQFDGFRGGTKWTSAMTSAFTGSTTRVLVDTRVGNGGDGQNVDWVVGLLRGHDQPWGMMLVPRGRADVADPEWLGGEAQDCVNQVSSSAFCALVNGIFSSSASVAPAAEKRIAWVNAIDVSANDFAPRTLQGRTDFRIFGPHPTEGAFGGVVEIPSLIRGWYGGSIQVQDTRFAASLSEVESARWESGHGVEPDVVVVQTVSDLLAGKDTMLEAARAWLAQ